MSAVSKTAKMLLHRKSLAFVVPFDKKYLIFMLLKVHKWTVISPFKNVLYYDERNCIFPI